MRASNWVDGLPNYFKYNNSVPNIIQYNYQKVYWCLLSKTKDKIREENKLRKENYNYTPLI